MKRTAVLLLAALLALPGIALADSPYAALQTANEKQTILKDLRKICTPQSSLSDAGWEKTIMADENNQQYIHEAVVAMQRNKPKNYWDALGKITCPDM